MIPPMRTTAAILSALLFVFAASAGADESAAPSHATPEEVSEAAASSPLEKARQRWDARPDGVDRGTVDRGIKFQDALVAAGKSKEALRIFRTCHRKSPGPASAFLYGRARGDEKGRILMRTALEEGLSGPQSLGAWIALAVAEVDAGDGEHASLAAARVTVLRGLPADWIYLAWIQEQLLGDAPAAMSSYKRAIKKQADHLDARNALAILLADKGQSKQAVALAEGTVVQHPQSSAAHLHLGLVHGMAGQSTQAAKALAKALACAGRDADALVDVAGAYTDIEEQDLALKALDLALEIDSDHGRALAAAGILAMDQGRLKDAKALLARAARVRGRDARIAFLEGVCAERMGRASAAADAYGRAMRYAPDRVDYVTALALARMNAGAYKSAVSVLKRAIKMAPTDGSLRLQLGIAQMHLKKYKLARAAFEESAELDRENPRPHYYLALIHGDKMGKSVLAKRALERYELLGGNDPTAIAWLKELRADLPGK